MRSFASLFTSIALPAGVGALTAVAGLCQAVTLLVALPAAGAAEVGADGTAEYTVSTVPEPPAPWGVAAEKWTELVRDRTNGRIVLRIHPNAELLHGEQTKEFEALREGRIDAAVGSSINWSPQVRELNLFSLPFLLPDAGALDTLTEGPVGERVFDAIGEAGVEPLAWGENGFRQLSNSQRPVLVPADVKGLKIRVVATPLLDDIFTALGARPVPMNWRDAQGALASGAVDGQENPLSVYAAARLQMLGQKYVTLWDYTADPLIFAFSGKVWQTFPREDRILIRGAAIEAGRLCIALSRGGDARAMASLPGDGVVIGQPDAAQHQQFVEATRPVFARWQERIGPELVAEAQKAIAERRPPERRP